MVLARDQKWAAQDSGPLVTTFVFRVRNLPAALYKALGGFATNGVNMTKLESYMVDGEFSATQFYADVDGHPEDKGLAFALEELKFFSREFRIVGVYPAIRSGRRSARRRSELRPSLDKSRSQDDGIHRISRPRPTTAARPRARLDRRLHHDELRGRIDADALAERPIGVN